jgi:hypothetical protein
MHPHSTLAARTPQPTTPATRALDTIAAALRRSLPFLGHDEALDLAVAVIYALRREGVAR